jgi:hypothetical protein
VRGGGGEGASYTNALPVHLNYSKLWKNLNGIKKEKIMYQFSKQIKYCLSLCEAVLSCKYKSIVKCPGLGKKLR